MSSSISYFTPLFPFWSYVPFYFICQEVGPSLYCGHILFFSFGNCCDIWPAFEDRFNLLLRVHYIVSLCPIHTFFDILRKYSGILCNPTSEFSDILWHPTKMYRPKAFLFTKIKPEYSDILYNPIHFPGALVYRIRQDP